MEKFGGLLKVISNGSYLDLKLISVIKLFTQVKKVTFLSEYIFICNDVRFSFSFFFFLFCYFHWLSDVW